MPNPEGKKEQQLNKIKIIENNSELLLPIDVKIFNTIITRFIMIF